MNDETTKFRDENGVKEERMVNFCFHSAHNASDMKAPKNAQEAMYGPEKDEWIPSMASEIMKFLNRKCWKKVPRTVPKRDKRKLMKAMW
jgi:hypothetical protein